MTEYSRAHRRGHRDLVGERSMRTGRHPSPWPCVAMLGALLLMCLMAPQYWETNVDCQDPTINAPADEGGATVGRSPNGRGGASSVRGNFNDLTLHTMPTEQDRWATTATDD